MTFAVVTGDAVAVVNVGSAFAVDDVVVGVTAAVAVVPLVCVGGAIVWAFVVVGVGEGSTMVGVGDLLPPDDAVVVVVVAVVSVLPGVIMGLFVVSLIAAELGLGGLLPIVVLVDVVSSVIVAVLGAVGIVDGNGDAVGIGVVVICGFTSADDCVCGSFSVDGWTTFVVVVGRVETRDDMPVSIVEGALVTVVMGGETSGGEVVVGDVSDKVLGIAVVPELGVSADTVDVDPVDADVSDGLLVGVVDDSVVETLVKEGPELGISVVAVDIDGTGSDVVELMFVLNSGPSVFILLVVMIVLGVRSVTGVNVD